MKRTAWTILFTFAAALGAFAQSNEAMDQILAANALQCGKAAYLLLVASDNIAEDAGDARSFDLLRELGWIGNKATAETPITISEYAYVLMRAFGMKGGLLYSLLPGPRYAFRELVDRGVIQGRVDPCDRLLGTSATNNISQL